MVYSCSSDDFFGLDETSYISETKNTRSATNCMTPFLTMSNFDMDTWTEQDYYIYNEAADRVEVTFSKELNRYVYGAKCGEDINVSDSLFNFVIEMYEQTNNIINLGNSRKIVRRKLNSPEQVISSVPYDCVPRAISNMGQGKPSYEQAMDTCDYYVAHWRDDGGIPAKFVGGLIKKFTSVTTRTDLSCYTTVTSLNKCVMLLRGGSFGHAVNAEKYYPQDNSGNGRIFYHSYGQSLTGQGNVEPSEMIAIYTFN